MARCNPIKRSDGYQICDRCRATIPYDQHMWKDCETNDIVCLACAFALNSAENPQMPHKRYREGLSLLRLDGVCDNEACSFRWKGPDGRYQCGCACVYNFAKEVEWLDGLLAEREREIAELRERLGRKEVQDGE